MMALSRLGAGFGRMGAATGASGGVITPPAGGPSLDFSDPDNSQNIPLLCTAGLELPPLDEWKPQKVHLWPRGSFLV